MSMLKLLELLHNHLTQPRWRQQRELWAHQADEQLRREHLRNLAQPSPFLTKFPPEIRNEIYDFIFHSTIEKPIGGQPEINLLRARPPEHAVLQTCHQIYNEAIYLYNARSSQYWTSNRFYILGRHIPISQLSTLSERNLSQIQYLVVFDRSVRHDGTGHGYCDGPAYQLLPDQRGWKVLFKVRGRWHATVIEITDLDHDSGLASWQSITVSRDGDLDDRFFEGRTPLSLGKQLQALGTL